MILRFAWTIQISLTTMTKIHSVGDIIATVLAPLEVFRWVLTTWNIYSFTTWLQRYLEKAATEWFKMRRIHLFRQYALFQVRFISLTFFPCRRFVWNFFRLENEHLNNCGEFRAVRDISVAPLNADDQTLLEQMMDQDDGVRNRSGKKIWKRSYSLSLRRPLLSSSQ